MMMKKWTGVLMLMLIVVNAGAQSALRKMPKGFTAKEVGVIVTQRFLATPHPNFGSPKPPGDITYPEVCAWLGALRFAAVADSKLAVRLKERFEPLFTTEQRLLPKKDHVDHNVFGTVPLQLYVQTKEPRYLDMGLPFAVSQWEAPTGGKESHLRWLKMGMTWQTRLWIDDMFMITAVQAQAYVATGDRKYIDRAAKEMVMYLDSIQRPNGLFYHAPDVPFFWGRGNGWMAAGMTELLRTLPESSQYRPRILEGYRKMMASLKQYQSADGMWRQLIDEPASWPETSCTGMFAYAMISGVKKGWLPAREYGDVARKAWLALVGYIDENGDVREVCEGTNKKNEKQYYLDRRRITGDMHGQAPILWCATALAEK
ncbi:glycoside hydrolase family 88 protein [Chitinophaga horti]|uniref:Glycoside hydrolase family 88 protein n=1 Tax=Chitinophaga horti TaxID=2920382 RepID=A0ABY6IUP8_9BACT|nr:glycoside hydrolase family 88 protein [Chitinophaga horti]UYQ91015.1 glycoside hydrolase family 88 protein [Chitinophaga horti]